MAILAALRTLSSLHAWRAESSDATPHPVAPAALAVLVFHLTPNALPPTLDLSTTKTQARSSMANIRTAMSVSYSAL